MVTEKIKAAAKQVTSVLKGRAGILNTLEKEHEEVNALMEKVLTASSPAKAAEDHYPTIRRKLLLHARAEQDVLYAACEKRPEIAATIGNSRKEHQELEDLLQGLDRTPVDSPRWLEDFRQLEQLVQQHVAEEEDELFERCETAFEDDELRDLDSKFEASKGSHEQGLTDVTMQHQAAQGRPMHHP